MTRSATPDSRTAVTARAAVASAVQKWNARSAITAAPAARSSDAMATRALGSRAGAAARGAHRGGGRHGPTGPVHARRCVVERAGCARTASVKADSQRAGAGLAARRDRQTAEAALTLNSARAEVRSLAWERGHRRGVKRSSA